MPSRWADRLRYALTYRLAIWYAVLFVTSAIALVGLTYALLSQSLQARDHEVIVSTLERYATEYETGGLASLNRAISSDRVEGRHERLLVRVLGGGAEAIFFNVPAGWSQFELTRLNDVDAGSTTSWISLPGRHERTVLEVASRRLPDGTLMQIGRSSDARDELLSHFRARVLTVLLCIVVIAVAGGALLTHVGLAPVRALAATVRAVIETGRLEARVPIRSSGDALGELGGQVNGMLDRIQGLIEGMRGALDNVAHDLRTPLMRLRSVVESALGSDDLAVAQSGLVRALEETERVSDTLTALMDISEAETGTLRLVREPLSLAEVVDEARDLYADLAEDKHVALTARVPPDLVLIADRSRLRQVVANLLDNAVKYTPEGGRVEVEGLADGNEATLNVRDTGIGIAGGELPHVWERLYRGDASRSERGLGLGLSLVKAVVTAHGGRVNVSSRPGAGSVFSITLPLSGAAPGPVRHPSAPR